MKFINISHAELGIRNIADRCEIFSNSPKFRKERTEMLIMLLSKTVKILNTCFMSQGLMGLWRSLLDQGTDIKNH